AHESLITPLLFFGHAGDPYARCRHLVALVDRDQHRGERLDGRGVRERARVKGLETDVVREPDDRLARLGVVAADEHVALDHVIELPQMALADILERGNYLDAGPEPALEGERDRLTVRQLHDIDPRRDERSGHVDQYLSLEVLAHFHGSRCLRLRRYG